MIQEARKHNDYTNQASDERMYFTQMYEQEKHITFKNTV